MKKILLLFLFCFTLLFTLNNNFIKKVNAENIIQDIGIISSNGYTRSVIQVDTTNFLLTDYSSFISPLTFTNFLGDYDVTLSYLDTNNNLHQLVLSYEMYNTQSSSPIYIYPKLTKDSPTLNDNWFKIVIWSYNIVSGPVNTRFLSNITFSAYYTAPFIQFNYLDGSFLHIYIECLKPDVNFFDFLNNDLSFRSTYYAHYDFTDYDYESEALRQYNELLTQMQDFNYNNVYNTAYQSRLDYLQSISDSANFNNLFKSVFTVPIKALDGLFDFEIFEYDMRYFPRTLFTICLITFIIRRLM